MVLNNLSLLGLLEWSWSSWIIKHCCNGPELGKFEKPWSDGIEIIEFISIILVLYCHDGPELIELYRMFKMVLE